MKKVFAFFLMLVVVANASAFRIEYGSNVSINRPINENLYIAGGTVTINASIHGDLIVAGGTVTINDTVSNDILLAGGNITFNGFVTGDIRCAGGNIRVSKNVTGELVIAGGTVIIDKGVTVEGLLISGGNISVYGNVDGDVRGAVGKLFLNGNVSQDVDCRGGTITVDGNIQGKAKLAATDQIIIGNSAAFNNDVRYWVPGKKVDFKQSVKNSKATYDESLQIQKGRWYYLGGLSILSVLWYIGMALLIIGIIQYLFGTIMQKAADTFFNNTLKSLGYGFVFFIGVPIAAAIAFITVIGVPVGLLLIFNYIVSIILVTTVSSVVIANWLNNRFNYRWSYWRLVFCALGVFVVLKLLSSIPFFGWFIILLIACISFGSILLNINWKKTKPVIAVA